MVTINIPNASFSTGYYTDFHHTEATTLTADQIAASMNDRFYIELSGEPEGNPSILGTGTMSFTDTGSVKNNTFMNQEDENDFVNNSSAHLEEFLGDAVGLPGQTLTGFDGTVYDFVVNISLYGVRFDGVEGSSEGTPVVGYLVVVNESGSEDPRYLFFPTADQDLSNMTLPAPGDPVPSDVSSVSHADRIDTIPGQSYPPGDYDENIGGTYINYFDLASAPSGAEPDYIVTGTDGGDLIDGAYVDPTDGDVVDGGDGNPLTPGVGDSDSIVAGSGNDTILSGAGDDTVDAGTGNDSVNGGVGDDSILGGEGSDTISGGSGADTIDGGAGDDDIILGAGDVASGGTGDDEFTIDPTGVSGAAITVDGGSDGTDGFPDDTANGNEGDTLDLSASTTGADITFGTDPEDGTVNGLDGDGDVDITFVEIENVIATDNNDTIDGSAATGSGINIDAAGGDDTVIGSGQDDTILGGTGDDSIAAGGGDDNVDAGEGSDTIGVTDSFGNDTVVGGEDPSGTDVDVLDASAATTDLTVDLSAPETGTMTDGADTINFSEIEVVATGSGDDSITGSNGNDVILTGAGSDTVDGGGGNDSINFGGPDGATDTLVLENGDGDDTLTGFEGPIDNGDGTYDPADQLNVTNLIDPDDNEPVTTTDTTITPDGNGNVTLTFPDGTSVTIEGAVPPTTDPTDPATESWLNAIGIPSGPDYIVTGTDGGDLIDGTYVDPTDGDVVDGGDGNPLTPGVGDSDSIVAGSGNDTILSGVGDDTVDAGTGNDSVNGGVGDDSILGGEGSDTISGGSGADTIDGGSGDDDIILGAGDVASGGTGDDEFTIDPTGVSGAAITVDGGSDGTDGFPDDTANGNEGDTLDLSASTTGADITFGTDPEDGTVNGLDGDGDVDITFVEIENVIATDNNDTIDGSAATGSGINIDAAGGDDTVIGSGQDDTILGGTGDDSIAAGGGDDNVDAGEGSDTIGVTDSFGNDTVVGGEDPSGTDVDVLDASAATTDLTVDLSAPETGTMTDGADTINFSEIEVVATGSGDDSITGSNGNDVILTGAGSDTVDGGGGNDSINFGGPDGATDTLVLENGDGDDTLTGFEGPIDNGDGTYDPADQLNVTNLIDPDDNEPVTTTDTTITPDGNGNVTLTFPDGTSVTIEGAVPPTTDPTDPATESWLNAIGIPSDQNYIVEGTDAGELIDGSYTGDPDGDFVDNNDGNPLNPGSAGGDNDSIVAGGGDDTIVGGSGDDTIQAGTGDDLVFGDFDTDSVLDTDPKSGMLAIELSDNPQSGSSNVTGLYSASVVDNGGDTIFNKDVSPDEMEEGSANLASGFLMTINGVDYLDVLELDTGNITIDGTAYDGYVAGLIDENGDVKYFFFPEGSQELTAITSTSTVTGTGQLDTGLTEGMPYANIAPYSSIGVPGNDSIITGEGSDTVFAGDGDDFINTRTSPGTGAPDSGLIYPDDPNTPENETLLFSYTADTDPENDRDSVDAGAGNDTILTGDDDDTIDGGSGNDVIDAGFDDDLVTGGTGADSIQGSEGSDTIDGGDDDDVIYGGVSPLDPNFYIAEVYDLTDDIDPDPNNNSDLLMGGAGNDRIYGQDDSDTLQGGTGDDTLDGGIDDDVLEGGDGADVLIGGEGDDEFIYAAGDGADTITDFGTGISGPIDDGDQTNNDFVDLSGFYNTSTLTSVNALIAGGGFATELGMLRADAEDGVIDGIIDGIDYSLIISGINLTIENGGSPVPGSALTFDTTNVMCFTAGTRIRTIDGLVAAESLRQGDLVWTKDDGYQPIRWIGHRTYSEQHLMDNPNIRPIVLRAGSLGVNIPERDLRVSPQHRMFVNSRTLNNLFKVKEALIAAKHLVQITGIDVDVDATSVTYIHFLFDRHQIVEAEGAESESLFTGPVALESVDEHARQEILDIFPELLDMDYDNLP
ncbi:Hint domain-containing protein, partial [Rhodobacteraceae bacterium]|nr:Hint domain-containing protein [Paracoccaceae bacterium]